MFRSHTLLKVKRSTKFCFVVSQKVSSRPGTCWSLYPTASLASLDQNISQQGKCLVRKARDEKRVHLVAQRVLNYFLSALKWLKVI